MELSRECKYDGYFSVDEIKVQTRDGSIVNREVMNRKDGVCALVIDTTTSEFIFVEQYRPGVRSRLLEVPAGTLDIPGEDPKEAIIREIDEEIGYKVDDISFITKCYMSPGGSTELLHFYVAYVSEKLHEGGGTPQEDIDIVRMNIDAIETHNFLDAKTKLAIIYYLFQNKL